MNYHALIPVKKLIQAKSRLAKDLYSKERIELVFIMLEHVINVLKSCDKISKITIVTSDEDVRYFSLSLGVSVEDEEMVGHNSDLTTAAEKETSEIDGLLTISADLPLVTTSDIQKILNLSHAHDVVLVPSKDNGTNAITVKKPLQLPYLFGENSFEKYKKEAKKLGLSFAIYESSTTAFDVDTIEDVQKLDTLKK